MIDFIAKNWSYVSVLFCIVAAIVAGIAGAAIKIRQESKEDFERFNYMQAELEREELLDAAEQQVKQRRRVRALS